MGETGERMAEMYLTQRGYSILARNYVCRGGEIDLIAEAGDTLVFVEVKMRSNPGRGEPQDAVNARKQRCICRAALHYLHATGALDRRVRFDVIAIMPPEIRHIPGAFDYIE